MLRYFVRHGLWCFILVGLCLFDSSVAQAKLSEQMTAQYFMRSLPAEIFDQTEWPITENEKNYLAETGKVKHWFIRTNTPDLLVISSATVEKSEMRIRVFRDSLGGGMVVVGTEGTLPCMAQFWQFDKEGRLTPFDEEPMVDVSDYFVTMSYLPPSISFSVTFCLRDDEKVEAVPSFWNMSGLLDIPMEKHVFLNWKDGHFVKDIVFRAILLKPTEDSLEKHIEQDAQVFATPDKGEAEAEFFEEETLENSDS